MCIGSGPISGNSGGGQEDNVDDELEWILAVPTMRERGHTAAKYQTGEQHEAWRWPEEEAAGVLLCGMLPR